MDYDETFCLVVKPTTARTMLTLVLSCDCHVPHLDVKNTFLLGTLIETVYCSQPIDFVDPTHPQLVCWLNKSLYSLKEAPWVWYHRFASYFVSLGFVEAKLDTSLFVYHRNADIVYLLLYADIILIALDPELLQCTTTILKQEFTMKDLRPLHHFLSVSVEQGHDDIFMH
jgi:hypothetical protein